MGGGSSQFITILQWGGVSRDPKFVLRNIWTAPKISEGKEKEVSGVAREGRKLIFVATVAAGGRGIFFLVAY